MQDHPNISGASPLDLCEVPPAAKQLGSVEPAELLPEANDATALAAAIETTLDGIPVEIVPAADTRSTSFGDEECWALVEAARAQSSGPLGHGTMLRKLLAERQAEDLVVVHAFFRTLTMRVLDSSAMDAATSILRGPAGQDEDERLESFEGYAGPYWPPGEYWVFDLVAEWLASKGRDAFEAALVDAESLAPLIRQNDRAIHFEGQTDVDATTRVLWAEKTGRPPDEFPSQIPAIEARKTWKPIPLAELPTRFPLLWEARARRPWNAFLKQQTLAPFLR